MHTDLLPHHHGEEEHHNIDQIRAQLAKADNFQIVADIFKQVGDPTRVRIFWLLCHCEEVFYKAADTDQSRLLHIMIEKVMAISCPET